MVPLEQPQRPQHAQRTQPQLGLGYCFVNLGQRPFNQLHVQPARMAQSLGEFSADLYLNSVAQWHPFSLFFSVAAPLKMVLPKKGSLSFRGPWATESITFLLLSPPKKWTLLDDNFIYGCVFLVPAGWWLSFWVSCKTTKTRVP